MGTPRGPAGTPGDEWVTGTGGRLRSPPKLSQLHLERSATPPQQPVSPLTPDFRSSGFSRSTTTGSSRTMPPNRRSYSVPSVVMTSSDTHSSYADIPPLPPVSKIQSRVRAHKARALLQQFQDEEEERLAEVHGVNRARPRHVGGSATPRQSFYRQSQAIPVSPIQSPSPSTPVFSPRGSEYGLQYRFANVSRDSFFSNRTAGNSTPDLLRHRTTLYSQSPGVSREYLVPPVGGDMLAEIEGDSSLFNELPTAGSEVLEMDAEIEPVELGSSPPRRELSATLSVRQKPPRYRPPQFDYLDTDGVSRYNTLPGEAFPLITNAASKEPEELPSGDERGDSTVQERTRRRATLETRESEEGEALRRSIEPELDPRTNRKMSDASQ